MLKGVFCVMLLGLTCSCTLFQDDRPAPETPPCELQNRPEYLSMDLSAASQSIVTALTMKLISEGRCLSYRIDPASQRKKETESVMLEVVRTGYARSGKKYTVCSESGPREWIFLIRENSSGRIIFRRTVPLR